MSVQVKEVKFDKENPPSYDGDILVEHVYQACKKAGGTVIMEVERFDIRHTGGGRWVIGRGKDTKTIARSNKLGQIMPVCKGEEKRFIPVE